MSDTVNCVLLRERLPALPFAPLPGPFGEKIQKSVSAKGWQRWLGHQTMLINEKRLSMGNAEHRAYLTEQMEKYLFGGEYDKPEGFTPTDNADR